MAATLLLALLVVGTGLAVTSSAGRAYLAAMASRVLSDKLVGEFQIGGVRLGLGQIVLDSIEARDAAGKTVLRAARLEASLHLAALLDGALVFDEIIAESPTVSLHRHGSQLAVAELFLPVSADDAGASDADRPSAPSQLRIVARRASVHDGKVVVPEVGTAAHVEGVGSFSYERAFRTELRFATAGLDLPGGVHVDVQVDAGALRLGDDETSHLEATLRVGGDPVRLSLRASSAQGTLTSAHAAVHGDLSPEALAAAGVVHADAGLRSAIGVRATASWSAVPPHGALTCALDTAGGQVSVAAEGTPGSGRIRLHAPLLSLTRVLTVPKLETAAFDLTIEAAQTPEGARLTLHSHLLSYGQIEVPGFTAHALLAPQRIHVTSLEIPSLTARGGSVHLDLQANDAGDLHGKLSAQLPRVPPGALLGTLGPVRRAALRLTARGEYQASKGAISADATLNLARAATAYGALDRLAAHLQVRGRAVHPVVQADVEALGLRFGTRQVDHLAATVRGGPSRYTVALRAQAQDAQALGDFNITLGEGEQQVHGSARVAGWLEQPIMLRVGALRVRPDAIEMHDVLANVGDGTLALDGRYGRTRASDLRVRVESLPLSLAERSNASGDRAAQGRVSGHLSMTGTAERPALDLSLRVKELALAGSHLGDLTVDAAIERVPKRVDAALSLRSSEGDELEFLLRGELPPGRTLFARLRRGQYELDLRAKQELDHLAALWTSYGLASAPRGVVELAGRVQGTPEEPLGQLTVAGTALGLSEHSPSIDGRLDLTLAHARSRLALSVRDGHGPLGRLDADASASLAVLLAAIQRERWMAVPASVRLVLEARPLAELSASVPYGADIGLSMRAELTTSAHAQPHFRFEAEARQTEAAAAASRCTDMEQPRLRLTAGLSDGRIAATLSGELSGRPVLHAELAGPAPALRALGKAPLTHGLTLAVDAHDIDLARLPWSCGALEGKLGLKLQGSALFTPQPVLTGRLEASGPRGSGGELAVATLAAVADRTGLRLTKAEVNQAGKRVLSAEASLPWRWSGFDIPHIDAPHCRAQAQMAGAPLGILLGFIPKIQQPSGEIDGSIRLQGCANVLDGLHGRLTLRDAALVVQGAALRVDGLSAALRLAGPTITLESFALRDQDGVLRGKGRVAFEHGQLGHAALALTAKDFPLRADAEVAGYVDGNIDVAVAWNKVPRQVQVTLADVSIRLPRHRSQTPQSLAQHPEITYVDKTPHDDLEEAKEAPVVPTEIALVAPQPLWIRRNDFGLQLKTGLRLHNDHEGSRVSGQITVLRGFLNLFGKGFEIANGQLVFDGGKRVDPTVTIDAVHKLGDGQTVTVKIRDRLSAPSVTLATSIAGISTNAEIMQLLVRGRDANAAETAQAQVGAALAGMTSQLFGGLTDTRLGKYVPVLSLEAGASSGTRMRAGVEASSLIPQHVRDVVEGAYVEGFVGSRNQGGNARTTGGVLIELYFPKNVVTGGTWELPNNWSVETTWEP